MGCQAQSAPARPSEARMVDLSQCAQVNGELNQARGRQMADDSAAERLQQQELDDLMQDLAAKGASERREAIAFTRLTKRQDAENEARVAREADETRAIRQRSEEAGCIPPDLQ